MQLKMKFVFLSKVLFDQVQTLLDRITQQLFCDLGMYWCEVVIHFAKSLLAFSVQTFWRRGTEDPVDPPRGNILVMFD